jgi:FMN phosphatase YigB (HAD superfamily)
MNEARYDMNATTINDLFRKSKLFCDIKDRLDDEGIKVLSLDVFDTLVFRTCDDPMSVFEHVGAIAESDRLTDPVIPSHLYRYLRHRASLKARRTSANDEITLDEIAEHLPFPSQVTTRLLQLELEAETHFSFLAPFADEIFSLASRKNRKVALTSNMYLSGDAIASIALDSVSPGQGYDELIVSSDHGLNKTNGGLFSIVCNKLDALPRSILHVGDDPYADLEGARSAGCRSLHFSAGKEWEEQQKIEQRFNLTLPRGQSTARNLAALMNPYHESPERFFFQLGATIWGPLLRGFAAWMAASCRNNQIDLVLSVTREGHLFHEALSRHIRFEGEALTSDVFEGSRRSTFFASIPENELLEAIQVVFTFTRFSVRSFLSTLGLSALEPRFAAYLDLPMPDTLAKSVGDRSLARLFLDSVQENIEPVKEHLLHSKQLLRRFLEAKVSSSTRFAYCDFGGGGSFARHMNQAVPALKSTLNFLFFAHGGAVRQLADLPIDSFIPYDQLTLSAIEHLKRSREICEIPLTGTSGSIMEYQLRDDGEIVAVADVVEAGKRTISQACFDAFQAGIASYNCVFEYPPINRIIQPINGVTAARMIERMIQFPTVFEAHHLGNMPYDDNFGKGCAYPVISEKHIDYVNAMGICEFWRDSATRSRRHISELPWPHEIPWPQGLITRIDQNWLQDHFLLRRGAENEEEVETLVSFVEARNHSTIAVYGAGKFFEQLLPRLQAGGVEVSHVVDRRALTSPFEMLGFHVVPLDVAINAGARTFVVASAAFTLEIANTIRAFAADKGVIVEVIALT